MQPLSDGPRLLIVDDDRDLRESLVDMLESEGYRVDSAASGREALALLARPAPLPALMLLDLVMPDLGGREFCEIQRRDDRLAGIPVLILTASQDLGRTLEGMEVLLKPFFVEALLAKVRRLTR